MNKKEYIKNIRTEISHLILKVLDGEITGKNALDGWPKEKMGLDKKVDKAWHELYHFYADEDIRNKDKKYNEWQIKKLRQIVDELLESSKILKKSSRPFLNNPI